MMAHCRLSRFLPWLLTALALLPAGIVSAAEITWGEPVEVYSDHQHNAFTDLTKYRGHYYLTFRQAPSHGLDLSSSIVVLRSSDPMRRDTAKWELVTALSMPGVDVRDPKITAAGENLVITAPSWREGHFYEKRLTAIAHSPDGRHWEPFRVGVEEYILWRPKRRGKFWYAPGYYRLSRGGEAHIRLFRSTDAINWEPQSVVIRQHGVNESELFFHPDGTAAVYSRGASFGESYLSTASAPYTTWISKRIYETVHGPLVAPLAGRFLGIFRARIDEQPRTAAYWVGGETFERLHVFPSGGDTSYAGFVQTGPGTAIVSYYSTHLKGKKTSIYTVPLRWK